MSKKNHTAFRNTPPVQPTFTALALVAALYSATPGIVGATSIISSNEALTATLEITFRPINKVVSRSSLVLSELGMRLGDATAGLGETTIINNDLQKYWEVDEQRSMVHEVPLTMLDDTTDMSAFILSFPGHIDNAPCLGAEGTLLGYVEHKGRTLESWRCAIDMVKAREEGELHLPAKQYFSPELGLVVYSLGHDQVEMELVDIAMATVDPALFMPAASLRSVSIEEFSGMQGVLDQYESQME